MKTFKELMIGDIIYVIDNRGSLTKTSDKYGNVYAAEIIRQEVVKSIENKKNFIYVNYVSGYNDRWLLRFTESTCNDTIIKDEDDGRYWYFINADEKDIHLKRLVLEKIAHYENQIKLARESNTKNIEDLRVAYWELLNPTT